MGAGFLCLFFNVFCFRYFDQATCSRHIPPGLYQLTCRCRRNTHSHSDSHRTNIQFFQQFWDKRLQGFQRHCCSPCVTCIATLTHTDLFIAVLVLKAVPTCCVYTLTAPLLCSRHFNIYSSH